MQYYLNYVLGIPNIVGKKAVIGTGVHHILEILALLKVKLQKEPNSKNLSVNSNLIGEVNVSVEDLYKESKLTIIEVSDINKSRANKTIYTYDVQLPFNHKRIGAEFVQNLIKLVSYKLAESSDKEWDATDFRMVQNCTWILLEMDEGIHDPRNKKIIESEKHFKLSLKEFDWAKFDYIVDGEKLSGYLEIMGTVDLISELDNNGLHITDYKTGSRKNWLTNEIKDYKYISNDPQLLFYNYCLRKLYPDIDEIMFDLIFIRDGGCFTVSFQQKHIKQMEDNLKFHFDAVRNNNSPRMLDPNQKNFLCNRVCSYYKENYYNTNTNICKFIHNSVDKIGAEETTKLYKNPDFQLGTYERGDV
jgi:hypothetical protein